MLNVKMYEYFRDNVTCNSLAQSRENAGLMKRRRQKLSLRLICTIKVAIIFSQFSRLILKPIMSLYLPSKAFSFYDEKSVYLLL